MNWSQGNARQAPAGLGYAIGLLSIAGALLIRWLLDPVLGDSLPYLTLFGGIAVAVWAGGWGPAALATAVGFIAADYWFHPPRQAIAANLELLAALAGYSFTCGVIIYLGELMHRAGQRAELEIAERRRADEALRASEERERARAAELQTVMEAVPAVIWIARDADCQLITGNRASRELLRLPPDQNASKSAPDGQRPTHFDVLRDGRVLPAEELPVQRAARGEEVRGFEEEVRFNDGTTRFLFGNATPLRDSVGRARGAVAAFVDITERRRGEEERERLLERLKDSEAHLEQHARDLEKTVAERTARLEETVAELESFSYSIAHDMRAPLRSLQGFSHFLLREYGEKLDATGQDYLRRIGVSAARMDRLILDVLNYSQILRADLRLSAVDVEALLRDIVESYPGLQSGSATIHVDGPIPKVRANEAALTQCFSNLLGNAVKFVAPGTVPRVRIRAEQHGDRVRVLVTDNGIGIPADQQLNIFNMFHRLSKEYEGTGIGLTIVRKAVERMGGSLGLQSQPGQGSTFWMELQRAEEKGDASPVNAGS